MLPFVSRPIVLEWLRAVRRTGISDDLWARRSSMLLVDRLIGQRA
jgi:hypothetical protein